MLVEKMGSGRYRCPCIYPRCKWVELDLIKASRCQVYRPSLGKCVFIVGMFP
jgi:hypothetical protein